MFDVWRDREASALICQGKRIASDACVATHARPAGVGRLAETAAHAARGSGTGLAAALME